MHAARLNWRRLAFLVALAGGGGCNPPHSEASAGRRAAALTLEERTAACEEDPRVRLGLVSGEVCVGADLFFRETFEGNGRTCATCHPVENNFTIDPASIAALPADDPLFVAELEADLEDLERPALLREFGLVLENVDGLGDLANRFTMRSVPHSLSLATSVARPPGGVSPPVERTGWSGDGAPGDGALRDFQTGAIVQHYPRSLDREAGTDFRLATGEELDRIAAYLRSVGRTNELDLALVRLEDAGAEAGRIVFRSAASRCNGCHANAGANAFGGNRNFDTGVERLRIPALDLLSIPLDGGFGGQGLAAPNFDADGDGVADSFGDGTFNTPPLIEAADSGPFFHTNAFETIEDAVAFYDTPEFNASPAGQFGAIDLSEEEIAQLGRFLRVINAAFNVQLALARLDGADRILRAASSPAVAQGLLDLAQVEVEDALDVLAAVSDLNEREQAELTTARNSIRQARAHWRYQTTLKKIEDAVTRLNAALDGLGNGLEMSIGEGTLMF